MKKVTIKQDEENVVPVEVMAESITAISAGIKKLLAGPLNEKALILLIQNAAPTIGGRYSNRKIGSEEIRATLGGIESLEKTYLKPKKQPAK